MADKRIVIEINGDVHELELTTDQAEGLRKGHEVDDWFRDFLWQQGGASFEPVKDDPRYREDENGPWMEMVIRVSAPASFDCSDCEGEGGDFAAKAGWSQEHGFFGADDWLQCGVCEGVGKELDVPDLA
jgi:hypothetical protein